MRWPALAAMTMACLASGCARLVSLTYQPTTPVAVRSIPVVGRVIVADGRANGDTTFVGAIVGPYDGLQTLYTTGPVAQAMTDAFDAALSRRGLLSPPGAGRVDLIVAMDSFNGTQYRDAAVDIAFRVQLRDHVTGRLLYYDGTRTTPVVGPAAFPPGAPPDLRALVQLAMSQAIDRTLDQPAFTAVLQSATIPPT